MHGPDGAPRTGPAAPLDLVSEPVREDPGASQRTLAAVCPYLVAEEGSWRAAIPMHEHRCMAVRPPGRLTAATQRTLCLLGDHVTCPAYQGARQRRAAELARDRIAADQVDMLRARPPARAMPLALERPTGTSRVSRPSRAEIPLALRRAGMPLATVAVITVLVVGASMLVGGGPTATPPPRQVSVASPGASPSASDIRPSATPVRSRSPAASPTLATASPAPLASLRTYRVKRGDSLARIAASFGTTVAALKALNGITDPPRIRIGQILKIPGE